MCAQLILASSSPRRAALLEQIAVEFTVVAPHIDESRRVAESPSTYVRRIALAKARSVPQPALPVLAADTIVTLGDEVLGKPGSRDKAREMLRRLSGRTHEVLTAVSMCNAGASSVIVSRARVEMRPIGEDEVERYVRTCEPHDKAGAYGIQGVAGIFVRSINGQPSTVAGLPLLETEHLLRAARIDSWQHRGA